MIYKSTYGKSFFKNTDRILQIGILLGAIPFLIIAIVPSSIIFAEIVKQLVIYSVGIFMAFRIKRIFLTNSKYKKFSLLALLLKIISTIFSIIFIIIFTLIIIATTTNNNTEIKMELFTLLFIGINFIANFFTTIPLVQTQKLRSQIRGFQMFLAQTLPDPKHFKSTNNEEDDLNTFNEKFIYIYALDLDKEWSKKFPPKEFGEDNLSPGTPGFNVVRFIQILDNLILDSRAARRIRY